MSEVRGPAGAGEALFLAADFCVLTWRKGQGSSVGSLIRGTPPS